MKTFKMIMCLALAVLLVNPIFTVSAADNNYNEQVIDDLFEGLNDTDKVLEMPEGGFLFGKAEIYDAEDESIKLGEYDSSTDRQSITVKDAKQQLIEENQNPSKVQARATSIPSQVMVLAPGQVYISKKFSGTGWRIGGYKFKAGGNGTWLKWSTFIDDGRVGDSGDVANQLNNSSVLYGSALYKGYPQYFSGGMTTGEHVMIYFTHNPINGTYYRVENN
ncbi:hypothetical protein [uncultured Holdemanella sp.]|uniref:hypothetical protein n=1 Tax=uncultured Holdemanella sp. TaxID=1763549 RepID=UPI0025850279|nr:hypothetical protein [uncultured Holdemanella sp.]